MDLKQLGGLNILESEKTFNFDVISDDVIVIDFWHVKCPFCIPALRKFITLSEKYKQYGIQFITCSLDVGDCSKESSLAVLEEDNKTINLFAKNKQHMKDFWNIKTVPHCVVLQRNQADTWNVLFSESPNKSDLNVFLSNFLEAGSCKATDQVVSPEICFTSIEF